MHAFGRIDIFLEVAAAGSFSKAARKLGISAPAVSKHVMALEEELGVKLLQRTTRHVSLTDAGQRYFERARLAIDELQAVAAEVQELRASPKGTLRINAPMSFGHMHLMPLLTSFALKYPDIEMQVALEDRKVDVLAEGFDVVIRIGTQEDSTLVTRHLADCPVLLVASPDYVRQHGTPRNIEDLAQHRFVSYSLQGGGVEWKYKTPTGKTGVFRNAAHFHANTAEMMLHAARDGLGIALLPIFSVDSLLKARQLLPILPGYTTHPDRSIFALMPPGRYRSAKLQLFIDWLAQGCKAMPWETHASRPIKT